MPDVAWSRNGTVLGIFTSPLTGSEAPRTNSESAALNGWLDFNRGTLLGKLEG